VANRYMFFSERELKCKCGQCAFGQNDMDPFFISKHIDLRMDAGFPFKVNSAYRCPYWDIQVGGSGIHSTGHAIDIGCYGERALWIMSNACKYELQGIGIKQHGPYNQRFIHLDDIYRSDKHPRPWPWTYI